MNYKCPLCESELQLIAGDQINPKNGVTLYCCNENCPAQECCGHGKDEKAAYEIVISKYKKSEIHRNI